MHYPIFCQGIMADKKPGKDSSGKRPPPPGWIVKKSTRYKREYYFNPATGESSWEIPKATNKQRVQPTKAENLNKTTQKIQEASPSTASSLGSTRHLTSEKLTQELNQKKKKKRKRKQKRKGEQESKIVLNLATNSQPKLAVTVTEEPRNDSGQGSLLSHVSISTSKTDTGLSSLRKKGWGAREKNAALCQKEEKSKGSKSKTGTKRGLSQDSLAESNLDDVGDDGDLQNSNTKNKKLKLNDEIQCGTSGNECFSVTNVTSPCKRIGFGKEKISDVDKLGTTASVEGRTGQPSLKNKGTWSLIADEEQKIANMSRAKKAQCPHSILSSPGDLSALSDVKNPKPSLKVTGADHISKVSIKLPKQGHNRLSAKTFTKHKQEEKSGKTVIKSGKSSTIGRETLDKVGAGQPQNGSASFSKVKYLPLSSIPSPRLNESSFSASYSSASMLQLQYSRPPVPNRGTSPTCPPVKPSQVEIDAESDVEMLENPIANQLLKDGSHQKTSVPVSCNLPPLMSPDGAMCTTLGSSTARSSSPCIDMRNIVQCRGLSSTVDNVATYMILDTNILLSHLDFVKQILEHLIPELGRPVLVIPWVVVQELDSLKDNKKGILHPESNIKTKAYAAVRFLYENFQKKHPNIIGQTPQESSQNLQNFKIENNDDRLLQCCLQFRQKYPSSKIVVFSNDTNLCTKCIITGFPAFNKQSIVSGMQQVVRGSELDTEVKGKTEECGSANIVSLHATAATSGITNIAPSCVTNQNSSPAYLTPPGVAVKAPSGANYQNSTQRKAVPKEKSRYERELQLSGDILHELILTLRESLSCVLEVEMKEAFDNLWLEVVLKKPPWTLKDILECIDKHWIAVFGLFLNRQLSQVVKRIIQHLKSAPAKSNLQQMKIFLGDSLEVCYELRKKSNYDGKLPKTIERLEQLQTVCCSVLSGSIEPNSLSHLEKTATRDDINSGNEHSQKGTKGHSHYLENTQNVNSQFPIESDSQVSNVTRPHEVESMETLEMNLENSGDILPRPSSVIGDLQPGHSSMQSMPVLDQENEQVIYFKFQSIWGVIHQYSQTIETVLNSPGTSVIPSNMPSREQAVEMLNRLYALSLELKMEFINFLSVPVSEAHLHPDEFFSFCQVLNNFLNYLNVKKEDQGPDIDPEKLLLYFLNESRREGMVNGLAQLSEMIVRMMNCGLTLELS